MSRLIESTTKGGEEWTIEDFVRSLRAIVREYKYQAVRKKLRRWSIAITVELREEGE